MRNKLAWEIGECMRAMTKKPVDKARSPTRSLGSFEKHHQVRSYSRLGSRGMRYCDFTLIVAREVKRSTADIAYGCFISFGMNA